MYRDDKIEMRTLTVCSHDMWTVFRAIHTLRYLQEQQSNYIENNTLVINVFDTTAAEYIYEFGIIYAFSEKGQHSQRLLLEMLFSPPDCVHTEIEVPMRAIDNLIEGLERLGVDEHETFAHLHWTATQEWDRND